MRRRSGKRYRVDLGAIALLRSERCSTFLAAGDGVGSFHRIVVYLGEFSVLLGTLDNPRAYVVGSFLW